MGSLVNLHAIDFPVGFSEVLWIVFDVVFAARSLSSANRIGVPKGLGPIAAEVGVEDLCKTKTRC